MKSIPTEQVIRRIQAENPWWKEPLDIGSNAIDLKQRGYFRVFNPLVNDLSVRRAILLMGPRRVGKTVLIHHVIQNLLADGVSPANICYLSVDHPIYNGLSLQDLLNLYVDASGTDALKQQLFVFFDEIQYLKYWEVHLKILVDQYPNIRFIASGSAAAALRLKSTESGAGRFTDFLLPPLTFHEYLELLEVDDLVEKSDVGWIKFNTPNIDKLNEYFLSYLNFGGYPEVIFSKTIQTDPGRFIKSDIIDRVLLRDLPSLYGIQDIQELNYLFTTLAFNTANEVSLETLSKNSGVAKNTIKRYIEYLEAAFLIKVVHRIDRNAKQFKRRNFFKVYLTNPSMWSALFETISPDGKEIGALAETGIFSQTFHSPAQRHYARWQNGEVDIVGLGSTQKPQWAVEVKWSDQFFKNPSKLKSLLNFCAHHKMKRVYVTSRTKQGKIDYKGFDIRFVPASLYCWIIGHNIVASAAKRANIIVEPETW